MFLLYISYSLGMFENSKYKCSNRQDANTGSLGESEDSFRQFNMIHKFTHESKVRKTGKRTTYIYSPVCDIHFKMQ